MRLCARIALRLAVTLAVIVPTARAWASQPTTWKVDGSPDPSSTLNVLRAITTTSATNAWAAGYYVDSSGQTRTLIAQYNGSLWFKELSFDFPVDDNYLNAVRATSTTNAWAVGTHGNATFAQTLIEHDDGSGWTLQKSPNPSQYRNVLAGVAAQSTTSAWAVGHKGKLGLCDTAPPAGTAAAGAARPEPAGRYSSPDASRPNFTTLVEHWDGLTWSVQKSPNPGATENRLDGIDPSLSSR